MKTELTGRLRAHSHSEAQGPRAVVLLARCDVELFQNAGLAVVVRDTRDSLPPVAWRIIGRSILKDDEAGIAGIEDLLEPPVIETGEILARLARRMEEKRALTKAVCGQERWRGR